MELIPLSPAIGLSSLPPSHDQYSQQSESPPPPPEFRTPEFRPPEFTAPEFTAPEFHEFP